MWSLVKKILNIRNKSNDTSTVSNDDVRRKQQMEDTRRRLRALQLEVEVITRKRF